jgi:hypothetical protein
MSLLEELAEKVKALGSHWTSYSVVGSFVLYVLGYLAVRFHLTALGVGTDLAVLDERYLFTGARFLVNLVLAIPKVVLLLGVVGAPLLLLYRWLSRSLSDGNTPAWLANPVVIAWMGIAVAVLSIQFVMCQCFFFDNLLLARQLPEPAWLAQLLLHDELMPLYFGVLVAATAISLWPLWMLRALAAPTPGTRFARALLALLAATQFLLLPINYGILILDKSLPRVAAVGERVLVSGEEAWLVWEGKEGVTWLVRRTEGSEARRSLVTLPRADAKRVEIIGHDPIFGALFQRPGAN